MTNSDGRTSTRPQLHLVNQSRPRTGEAALAPNSDRGNQEVAGASTPAAALDLRADENVLLERARGRDVLAFELLMRRNNQRVYRVVRSIIKEASEIEDVMQQAYLQAFTHLDQYSGAAQWSTWLCRIAINEAKGRLRQQKRFLPIEGVSEEAEVQDPSRTDTMNPEQTLAGRELSEMVENAIDELPDLYRTVLMMREVEGMSTNEVAQVLDVEPDVVKTRLHRARAALRCNVEDRIGEGMKSAYEFGNERCDRVVAGVLARLELSR